MATLKTSAELLEAIKSFKGEAQPDIGKYRYVIYARKSTDDKEKQARSLPDQILACKEYAVAHGLVLGKPEIIQEAESAKTSDTRPKFREMLEAIKQGKYDGILAWHPDRLARNMRDAGEVIDLLDKQIIKDLKFVSFYFDHSTSGKMLLGFTFVISKQYSDQLGDNVSRGNERSIEDARYINKAKHGYRKDAEQRLWPDGDNFLYIKQAFRMRLEGKTLDEIADYLKRSGYQKWTRHGTHIPYKWDKQKVHKLLKDPAYTGVIAYGKKGYVDLTAKYDFTPAVSVEDFMSINRLDEKSEFFKLSRRYRKGEEIKANLMRGMVFCSECGEEMVAGITNKKNSTKGITRYFYYRCTTEDCDRRGKSVRAKVIMDYIRGFLDTKPFSSKEAYQHYEKEMQRVHEERVRTARSAILALKTKKSKLDERHLNIKELLLQEQDEGIKTTFKKDLKQAEADMSKADEDIQGLEKQIKDQKAAVLAYPEFAELMENMGQTIASIKNMAELDFVVRKVFLNFTVSAKNVENTTLSAPFDALYELKLNNCGHERTRTSKDCSIRF